MKLEEKLKNKFLYNKEKNLFYDFKELIIEIFSGIHFQNYMSKIRL